MCTVKVKQSISDCKLYPEIETEAKPKANAVLDLKTY